MLMAASVGRGSPGRRLFQSLLLLVPPPLFSIFLSLEGNFGISYSIEVLLGVGRSI